jgi:hypothetical protein
MLNMESASVAGLQLRVTLHPNHLNIQPEANNWANKIAHIMKEQFGLKSKEQTGAYQCSYPEWFDRVSLPPQYRVPDFTKFFDSDNVSIVEHVGRYLAWYGKISTHNPMMVKLFPLSFSRSAFA